MSMMHTVSPSASPDHERLRLRRQFALGPRAAPGLAGWPTAMVADDLVLTYHPDLQVTQAGEAGRLLTLLGWMLDPEAPEATNAQILTGLLPALDATEAVERLVAGAARLGGRWALLVCVGAEARLITDPVGYRQVYYTLPDVAEPWCASQPGLISDLLGLQPDPEAMAFIERFRCVDSQYWWPVDSSPYAEVRHLLPNHALDLRRSSVRRCWPTSPLAPLPAAEAARRGAALLGGLVAAADRRFPLALAMTAGRDTRVILAAVRPLKERVHYFTLVYWGEAGDQADVQVSRRLLAQSGLPYQVIQCPEAMDPAFATIYRGNVMTAREAYGPLAQGLAAQLPADCVYMKGNAIPIIKGAYRRRLRAGEQANDARTLARIVGLEGDAFAITAYQRWLDGVGDLHGIDLLDLFWWEDREASWQAMSQLEWDVANEAFVPFNCRMFLEAMLAVAPEHRRPPEYGLHQQLIKALWPELLREPINPHKEQSTPSSLRWLQPFGRLAPAPIRRVLRRALRSALSWRPSPARRGFPERWARLWMRWAGPGRAGRAAAGVAAWFIPPYTARFALARLGPCGYIDPGAILNHRGLQLGANIFIDDRVVLNQANNGGALSLGDRAHILRDTIMATGAGGSISIGADTYIQPRCQIMGYKGVIQIGRDVQIAPNCVIYAYNHGIAAGSLIRSQPLQTKGGVTIGDDVWLGANVVVLDGVTIGSGAVIGAGSVVTRDIPAMAVAVGNPARVVRLRSEESMA